MSRQCKPWTESELSLLRRQLEFPGFVPIVGMRSYAAISMKLSRMKIPAERKARRPRGGFVAAVRDYCDKNAVSDRVVAAALNTTHQEIFKARKRAGICDYRTRLWTAAWHSVASDKKHLQYARALAGQWARNAPHLADEFESAAMVGLVKAARRWDERKASFSTLLVLCVRSELSDTWSKYKPLGYRWKERGDGSPPPITLSFTGYLPSGDDLDVSEDRRTPIRARLAVHNKDYQQSRKAEA